MLRSIVSGKQHVELALGQAHKLTVFSACPSQTSNGRYIVACQLPGQADGQVFVK